MSLNFSGSHMLACTSSRAQRELDVGACPGHHSLCDEAGYLKDIITLEHYT